MTIMLLAPFAFVASLTSLIWLCYFACVNGRLPRLPTVDVERWLSAMLSAAEFVVSIGRGVHQEIDPWRPPPDRTKVSKHYARWYREVYVTEKKKVMRVDMHPLSDREFDS